MKYFRVKEWEKYQHYKDRSPPWIKLHRELLTSQTWVMLDDEKKALAIACMLLAAATDNRIPLDASYVQRVAYLKSTPDFSDLIQVDFIEIIDEKQDSASAPLADASKPYSETEKSTDQSRSEKSTSASATPTRKHVSRETSADPDWWLDFKLAYPHRAGDQGWRRAQKAALARQSEGHAVEEFIAGARRYSAFCEATQKTGTEFVKQAATFLGPDKPFLQPWGLPASKAQVKQDRNLAASLQWLADEEAKDAAH